MYIYNMKDEELEKVWKFDEIKGFRWNQERISSIITRMIMRTNDMVIKTGGYGNNGIRCSPLLFTLISTTQFFNPNTENHCHGILNGVIPVDIDLTMPCDTFYVYDINDDAKKGLYGRFEGLNEDLIFGYNEKSEW